MLRCALTGRPSLGVRSIPKSSKNAFLVTGRVRSLVTGLSKSPILLSSPALSLDRATGPVNSVHRASGPLVPARPIPQTFQPLARVSLTLVTGLYQSVWSLGSWRPVLRDEFRSLPNFATLDRMCQPPSVTPCARVLAYFHKHFRRRN